MTVPPLFQAVRAVSAEFASRIYFPVAITVAISLAALLIVSICLVTISGWWWLLLAPVILCYIVFGVIALIAGLLLRLLKPSQSKAQRKQVKSFVDKLQGVSEVIQTPKFVLLFNLVKDVLVPSQESYVKKVSSHAVSIRPDFTALVDSFR